MLYGRSGTWRYRIRQTIPFVQTLIDASRGTPTSLTGIDAVSLRTRQTEHAAATALLGQLLWLDVMAMVSSGCESLLGIEHGAMLDSEIVDMSSKFACGNKIVKILAKISGLRHWRESAKAQGNLDVSILAARGAEILLELDAVLLEVETSRAPFAQSDLTAAELQLNFVSHGDAHQFEPIQQATLYCRTAKVYLHSVISGPIYRLPSISQEVSAVLAMFRTEKVQIETSQAIWPLCVAACFSSASDLQNLGLGYCQVVTARDRSCVMRGRALKIAERCHEFRTQGSDRDWIEAAQDLGEDLLLL